MAVNDPPSQDGPAKIQLSFQGGGTKLITLIAVVDAVQRLEGRGVIDVTFVSGTSAGSIAAALLSGKKNIEDIEGERIDEIVSFIKSNKKFSQLSNGSLFSRSRKLIDLFNGKPLIGESVFDRLLRLILSAADVDPNAKLTELARKSLFTSTSLFDKRVSYFSSVDRIGDWDFDQTRTLIDAIKASANVPFLFTSFAENNKNWRSAFVDGGLCENLPFDPLLDKNHVDRYGQVVGVTLTPDDKKWPPQSMKGFVDLLFETAINNSVERARKSISLDYIYEASSSQASFDFSRLRSDFRSTAEYIAARKAAEQWFERRARTISVRAKDKVHLIAAAPTSKAMMRSVWSAYSRRAASRFYSIEHSSIVHCSYRKSSNPDHLLRRDLLIRAHLLPKQVGFALVEYPIGNSMLNENQVYPTRVVVEKVLAGTNERHQIDFELTPMLIDKHDELGRRNVYRGLLTFDDPLPPLGPHEDPDSGDKILIWYEQAVDNLFPILEEKSGARDHMGLVMGGQGVIKTGSIILIADTDRWGYRAVQDATSEELRPLTMAQLPNWLALLCDASLPFQGWSIRDLGRGKWARVSLEPAGNEGVAHSSE